MTPPKTPSDLVRIKFTRNSAVCDPPSYKPSRFNAHTLADDERLLVYNSLTGQICAVPAKHREEAAHYLSARGHTGALSDLGEYLLAQGFIVASSVDESGRWDVRYGIQQYRQDRLELILLSSEDCNFRCIYCSQEFKRGSMHRNVRDGIRNLVLSRIKQLAVLQVSWFGGEPLMGYDAIEELAPVFKVLTEAHGVHFNSGMTTNGYLLDKTRAANLLSWGVTDYQITLDGLALEHDSHRPLSSGGRTFDRILENLYAMKSLPAQFEVAIRCNFDQNNSGSIRDLLKELQALALGDPRFMLRFRPVGKWGGPNDDTLSVCGVREATHELVQLSSTALKLGMRTGSPDSGLTPGPGSVCYAARPYNLIIGADGKIMKCTVVLDTEERNIVGHLSPDGNVAYNEDNFARWTRPYYRTDAMCNQCFFVPVCQGSICPLPRVTSGERDCPSQKTAIQQTLKNVYHLQTLKRAVAATNSEDSGNPEAPYLPTTTLVS
jgi:uncharacterized protein